MKVDFVTVTFSRDFNLLKLQARSLALCVPESFINSIILICNDTIENMEILRAIIIPEYKHLAEKVQIIESTTIHLSPDPNLNYGWFPQQILKLRAYKVTSAKYYIVLDSKNHFIRPITEDYFFQDGKPKQVIEDYTEHFMRIYIINTLNVFENNKNNIKDRFIHYYTDSEKNVPSFQTLLTPVIFIREICKSIDENMNLDYFLNGQNTFAEFAIYAAYLQYNTLQNEYIQTRQRLCFTEPNSRERWLDILKPPIDEQPYSILGICVTRFNEFSAEELELLKNRWVATKLCTLDEANNIHRIYSFCLNPHNNSPAQSWSREIF